MTIETNLRDDLWVVVCRTDKVGRRKGHYVLATRHLFATRADAEKYASTINAARQPLVVEGHFTALNFISQ